VIYKKFKRLDLSFLLGTKSLLTFVPIILCIFMFSLFFVSCNRPVEGDSITLEFTTNYVKTYDVNGAFGFNEVDCIVFRCGSFDLNEVGVVAKISKSKNLKATTLVFVKPTQSGDAYADYIQIAAAPVVGKEYEYDMAQAKFYQVTPSSVEAAIDNYGIPYPDWQTGACNDSEKFPCCE